jgi:hypothetical protein
MKTELNVNQKQIEQAAQQWFEIVLAHLSHKKNPELYPALVIANKNKNKDYEPACNR